MKIKPVKIVATVGPSTSSSEMIFRLAEEGVDIFRLNLSHADRDVLVEVIKSIRDAEEKLERPLTIMGDLAGPKIRIGNVDSDIILENKQLVKIFAKEMVGNNEGFSVNYPSIIPQLKKGSEIYIDDGLIKLVVEEEEQDGAVLAKVLVGGKLKPYKGFFGQGIVLPLKELSDKDKRDIKFMVEQDADALAISFIQSPEDVLRVRRELPESSKMILIAKIETQSGMEQAGDILQVSDGLMIARGDLGLGVSMSEVPLIQKELINLCLRRAKPVITATQMLESMTHNPLPTRAEVTDVANAILDGTDAVMLSGETAVGDFPLETIRMMVRIIKSTAPHIEVREFHDENEPAHAVGASAGKMADQIGAKLVIDFTHSGVSAQQVARYRHAKPIIALSTNMATLRKLNYTWGVYPRQRKETSDFYHLIEQAKHFAKHNDVKELEAGDKYVIAAGIPFNTAGSTNLLYVDSV